MAVRIAHSGAEGMSEIERERPDLILLDIMMDNDADGFNLAYKLKEDKVYREIPIIILSGYTDHLKDKLKLIRICNGPRLAGGGRNQEARVACIHRRKRLSECLPDLRNEEEIMHYYISN